jgi:hypothetical protein
MDLRKATLFVIIGMCCTFVLRLIGTVVGDGLGSLLVARISVLVYLLSGLAAVLFFVYFHREYARENQPDLRNAAALAAIGAGASTLIHLKGVWMVFSVRLLPGAFIASHWMELLFPIFGLAAALYFFVILRRESAGAGDSIIEKGSLAAIVGYTIFLVMQAVTILNYLATGQFKWLSQHSRTVSLAVFPLVLAGFVTVLYFFVTFYRAHTQRRDA